MKLAYNYIRVSTEEQAKEGYSIDNQKRVCKEFAEANGYKVIGVFVDDGKSGRTTDRPAFQEMLESINERHIDALVIPKIDRLFRNVGDFSKTRKEFKERGIKLLSVAENDVTEGLIGNIFASVAEWESDVNGQRTRDALMQKFREGWQPTPPLLGYRTVGTGKEKKTCEPDPTSSPIIQELFKKFATGNYTIKKLEKWLATEPIRSKNGLPLGHGVIGNILNNPFYYGLIRWHGEAKIGNHTPIISKELYDDCQYILAMHRDFILRKRTYDFLLRGTIFCEECGQKYTAEWHKDEKKFKDRGGKIAYYHCQKRNGNGCNSPYVEVEELENKVAEDFKNLQFTQPFIDAVIAKAREMLDNSRKTVNGEKQALINQKTALEVKRDRLEDDLLDRTIGKDTYKRKHAEIEDKISAIDEKIITVEAKNKLDVSIIEEVLAFTTNIYSAYQEAPYLLKKKYLRFFYRKIFVEKRAIVRVEPTPVFKSLRENHLVIIGNNWLPRLDSNQEP